MLRPVPLIVAACLAEIVGMASASTFPALLPTFQAEWALTNTEAGWINAVYYGGYLVAVLVLVSLTDRVDPRRIYLGSMALSCAATAGFALLAAGFWSALALRVLAGVGLAGTYMPGLRILSDRLTGRAQSRAVAFYTSSFGIGSSLSYYLSGLSAQWMGWPQTFALAALGPAVAVVLGWALLPAQPGPRGEGLALRPRDFLRVLRNRRAMGYVLAYALHNWELFAFRSWIVAYLVFLQRARPGLALPFVPTTLAAIANMMSVPSSVLGNEASTRFGRRRVVTVVMFGSGLLACAFGWVAGWPGVAITCFVVVYGWSVTAESSSVTAGTVAAAEKGLQGMTMAAHGSIGFLGSFLGPLMFGVVLDVSGGGDTTGSWGIAFAAMGVAVALGPLVMLPLARGGARTATSERAAS